MKGERLTEKALLKSIIENYPILTTMEVAAPRGFGISGRNRLNELSKDYDFKYTHCPARPTKGDPGHYDFSEIPLYRFKEILEYEEGGI